jgi:mRNA interferase RelE/StbE
MKECSLEFDERALREWDALDGSVRKKFEKKLEKINLEPSFPGK